MGLGVPAASGETAHDLIQAAHDELAAVTDASDSEIELLARSFQKLAAQSTALLDLASGIVGCVESEAVKSVLPRVQTLGSAAISLVEASVMATRGILEMAGAEMKVLKQLSKVTGRQSGIALRTRVLTMMTNVEVGHLGGLGTGFEYLAGELSNFSRMLTEDTDELERHTDSHRIGVEATNRILQSELPRLAEELRGIKASLGEDMTALESGLAKLGSIPVRFKACVREIAAHTAGVVAAIQSYDITRQQMDHVQNAIELMSAAVLRNGKRRGRDGRELRKVATGITVQVFQLRHIRDSVASWIAQIRLCLRAMLTVSTSELVEVGPMVREREGEISARLGHIASLQDESRNYSERIRGTGGKQTCLVQLIDEQVKKATMARQTLHLLSLNAIVEASRLGASANAVLEIGSGISDLSLEWGRVTDQSELAMQDISGLMRQVESLVATFSEAEDPELQEALLQAREGLESLRSTSVCAANQARDIDLGLAKMRAMADGIARSVDLLDTSYGRIDRVLDHLEKVQLHLNSDCAGDPEFDVEVMREYFSASYTTEIEREVLDAALGGGAPPPIQQPLEGNGVELF
jgi:hypothetical protein